MKDNKSHSAQKRTVSNIYSKSYIQSSEDMSKLSQEIIFGRYLPILESLAAENDPVDVHGLNAAVAMDFATAYLFGIQNGSNFLEDIETRRNWLEMFQSRRPYAFWAAEFPGLVSVLTFLGRLKLQGTPHWLDTATIGMESWCLEMCKAAKLSAHSVVSAKSSEKTMSTNPVVYDQLSRSLSASAPKNPSPVPQELVIASELLDHIGAAHETTGITLTYIIHELSQRPEMQACLRAELLSLTPTLQRQSDTRSLPNARLIDALPFLHGVLMETLRLRTATPGPLPRVTPSIPTSLAESPPLPAGVRVSANAYCLHRNKDVFPDPDDWLPNRWLDESKERKNEMMRWFWAFGSGGRMCIGSHFAVQGTFFFPFLPSSNNGRFQARPQTIYKRDQLLMRMHF